MSASYRLALLKEKREKRRKKAFQSLNTEAEDAAFPLSLDMDTLTYTNTFNTYLTKLKRSEYQSKNPDLFCWNQTPRYMNKLLVPPHLVPSSSRQSVSSRNMPDSPENETGAEDVGPARKPSTAFNKTSSTKSLKKDVPTKLEKISSSVPKTQRRKQKKTLDLDLAEFESLTKLSPFHTKTTYPVSKIQTDLLTSRSDPASMGVNNHQFMLNHFDKRNYSINKIVSQIQADGELLNKDSIMRETLAKLKWVSRKPTRPQTQVGEPFLTINSARSHLPGQSEDMTAKMKNSLLETSDLTRQTAQKKRGSTLEPEPVAVYRQPSQKKLVVIDERLRTSSEAEGVPVTRQTTQKRGEHRISTNESEPIIRQISQMSQKRVFDLNLQQVLSNMDDDAKSVRGKKGKISFRTTEKAKRAAQSLKKRGSDMWGNAQEKNLIKDIKTGIQKLDEFSAQRDFVREGDRPPSAPEDDHNKPLKSFMQFVRTSSMTWKTKTPDEEAMLKVTKVRIKNDNIFNYKNYFKKKYMENGMNMEVSPELKSRIVSFEKDVKSSINRIKAMSNNKNHLGVIDGKF